MESNINPQIEILQKYLYDMRHITIRLKGTGSLLLGITLLNIGIILGYGSGLISLYDFEYRILSILLIILSVSCIALALYYDVIRREGNILFEELSNELHGKNNDIKEYELFEEIRLDAKVTLRRFTHNSELPLIPGRYGPAILAALNLLIFFLYIIVVQGKNLQI